MVALEDAHVDIHSLVQAKYRFVAGVLSINPLVTPHVLLVALVIECLPDKHKWSGHLRSPTSQFIDDKKLRSAVAEYGDLVPLLSTMLDIL